MTMIYQSFTCPYCGKEYEKEMKSVDHIIPKQIGGSDKFRIVSCSGCNNKISKIEQQAIRTLTINWLITEMYDDGFDVKKRRKRNIIPLQKGVGIGFGGLVKTFYDSNKKEKILQILPLPHSPPARNFFKRKSFTVFTPVSACEDNERDIISLTSLTNKIILGACVWLWGDKFSKSNHADNLRSQMWNMNIDRIHQMSSSDKHLEHPSDSKKDYMDNRPHHSVLIGQLENKVVGLLNLFGSYESLTLIGDLDTNFKKWLDGIGIVIIQKTTSNEVLKMSWEDYEKYKSSN